MYHNPVMIKEVLEEMNPQPGENFIDCTLGNAGHTIEILGRTKPDGRILGFELDIKASGEAKERLQELPCHSKLSKSEEWSNFGEEGLLSRVHPVKSDKVGAKQFNRVEIIEDNFRNIKKYKNKLPKIDGILADLGLRSGQIEESGKGFSFNADEPLDMRFGSEGTSAEEIVNTYTTDELAHIFREYGEEKNYQHIAKEIVKARKNKPIKTTGELAEIILDFYRQKLKTKKEIPWLGGIHPATRIFQALRIEANDELGALKKLLEDGSEILSPGGRIGIISYHSLEDRIVKRFYRTSPQLVVKTKKPIIPSEEEVKKNRRARSAKFRVAIKE
ncbi:16S rRNA (cytosine(1402)-N(4))-methyltransferase RsmH [Candidatus Parcubacteria bacterium]|nr:16S rRNA (cytosine(1402)-N(4))-methyltransferase RsmH [Candidatus Parcubacteria bacterium]